MTNLEQLQVLANILQENMGNRITPVMINGIINVLHEKLTVQQQSEETVTQQ